MMLERRSALAAHRSSVPGSTLGVLPGHQPAVVISERRTLAILQISAFAATTGDAAAQLSTALGLPVPLPNRFTGDASRNLRAIAPGVWQAVAAEGGLPGAPALREALHGVATVVDLSHARACVRLKGPGGARTLAAHCGLDLHASVFAPGSATNTRFGHVGMTLARIDGIGDDPAFELLVFRGYAEFVFEALLEAGAEFGIRVGE